jgi:preprotein translocase subunit SecF
MKKYIYSIAITCMVIVIVGCGGEEVTEINNTQQGEVVEQNNTIEENVDTTKEMSSTDVVDMQESLEEQLGTNDFDETEVEKEQKADINIKQCDEGYIYNTDLNECFKLGQENEDSKDIDVKIDPVVKECNEKGGIYNTQAQKCFM